MTMWLALFFFWLFALGLILAFIRGAQQLRGDDNVD